MATPLPLHQLGPCGGGSFLRSLDSVTAWWVPIGKTYKSVGPSLGLWLSGASHSRDSPHSTSSSSLSFLVYWTFQLKWLLVQIIICLSCLPGGAHLFRFGDGSLACSLSSLRCWRKVVASQLVQLFLIVRTGIVASKLFICLNWNQSSCDEVLRNDGLLFLNY